MSNPATFSRISVLAALWLACAAAPSLPSPGWGAQPAASADAPPKLTYADQGWSDADRDAFYTTSQGSSLLPYQWFMALRRLDIDAPFAGDKLQRYGYLPNEHPRKNFENLPIGFVVDGDQKSGDLGLTCAACHTGQIEYQHGGVRSALRLDGARARADFQAFLTDLMTACQATLAQPGRFRTFAKTVLGSAYSDAKASQLKVDLAAWTNKFSDFMKKSLPASPWGPGRVDAFGMIFNRVTGLDLGIASNLKTADAPVSYPFLWNATRQDRTQWNGSAPGGLYVHALARNTGEALGVFANFKPSLVGRYIPPIPPLILYGKNSIDFDGLQTLEEKLAKLRPPPWPADVFGFDAKLAKQGEPLFEKYCKECHDDKPSALVVDAWQTPVRAVGTDPRMFQNAERTVDPGILRGATIPSPPFDTTLGPSSNAGDVLAVAAIGILADELAHEVARSQIGGARRALKQDAAKLFPDQTVNLKEVRQFIADIKGELAELYRPPPSVGAPAAYEARSLHGIWAAAPYLHNGSVPNLWELLTPAKERKTSFIVGTRSFDPKTVGYDTEQSGLAGVRFTADPTNGDGNGNAGHEYGTDLTPEERWAIIEYLKGL